MDDATITSVCKALSDPNRLRIVRMLSGSEKCACVLLEKLGITQPTLSHHMKVLAECSLVRARKDGKWMRYSLDCATLTAFKGFIASLECEGCGGDEERRDSGGSCCCGGRYK